MEVVVPSPNGSPPIRAIDHFDFNGVRVSPYLSAPSSPKRFGDYDYLSAPTSPSRFYSEFDYFSASPSTLYDWENKSGTPKGAKHNNNNNNNNGDDGDDGGFAFFVSRESETSSRSAEELFDGGKIKPLKEDELLESARSPLLSPSRPRRSPLAQGKKAIIEAFSPRKKKESRDPLGGERRGRDRTPVAEISASNSGRRVTRSHSPYRISHWEEESNQPQNNKEDSASTVSSSKSSRKWRLRDFLLFRSASEGRGSSKDPFRKYPVLYKKAEDGKASPLRSSDIPRSRRKEPVSAHELHYARKKAESQDLKKRTFLPYKQGILGRLAGLGSLNR